MRRLSMPIVPEYLKLAMFHTHARFNLQGLGRLCGIQWEAFKCCSKILALFNKSNKLPSALLSANETASNSDVVKLLQICKTRFGSTLLCMKSILKNKPGLRQLVERTQLISDKDVIDIIKDSTFWYRLDRPMQIFTPLFDLLEASEASVFSPSACYVASLKLVHFIDIAVRSNLGFTTHDLQQLVLQILAFLLYPLRCRILHGVE